MPALAGGCKSTAIAQDLCKQCYKERIYQDYCCQGKTRRAQLVNEPMLMTDGKNLLKRHIIWEEAASQKAEK